MSRRSTPSSIPLGAHSHHVLRADADAAFGSAERASDRNERPHRGPSALEALRLLAGCALLCWRVTGLNAAQLLAQIVEARLLVLACRLDLDPEAIEANADAVQTADVAECFDRDTALMALEALRRACDDPGVIAREGTRATLALLDLQRAFGDVALLATTVQTRRAARKVGAA